MLIMLEKSRMSPFFRVDSQSAAQLAIRDRPLQRRLFYEYVPSSTSPLFLIHGGHSTQGEFLTAISFKLL